LDASYKFGSQLTRFEKEKDHKPSRKDEEPEKSFQKGPNNNKRGKQGKQKEIQ